MSKQQQFIKAMEELSLEEFLMEIYGDNYNPRMLKKLKEIQEETKVSDPVIKVVFHYCAIMNGGGNVHQNYVTKIAHHCHRMNIQTAEEAMKQLKRERKKRMA